MGRKEWIATNIQKHISNLKRQKGIPEHIIEKMELLDHTDTSSIAKITAIVAEWEGKERIEQERRLKRTSLHNKLIRFVNWYLKNRSPKVSTNGLNSIHKALEELNRGENLSSLRWVVDLMDSYTDSGEYRPTNLTRKKADW